MRMQGYCGVYKWTILKRTSPEVKCLHPTSSRREMCTSSVSNVIYHKFSHGAAFYTLNGKNVHVMLELKRTPGPSCSKLTTLLVNDSLKFQTLISQICQYFLLKQCEKLLQLLSFFQQKISVYLVNEVVKHLTS